MHALAWPPSGPIFVRLFRSGLVTYGARALGPIVRPYSLPGHGACLLLTIATVALYNFIHDLIYIN